MVAESGIGEMMKENEKVEGDSLVVTGRVVDESDESAVGVVVRAILNGKEIGGAVTDSIGEYKIVFRNEVLKNFDLDFRVIGYERKIIPIDINSLENPIMVKLELVDGIMGWTGQVTPIRLTPIKLDIDPIDIESIKLD